MRRSDRAQDLDFCLALIDSCTHGVAALATGPDEAPYCLPLSLVRKGKSLYFHCAKEGRKADLLRRDPRVCVTFVGRDDPVYEAEKNNFTTCFQSVIATGKAVEVTEKEEKLEALELLCRRMTPEAMTGDNFIRAASRSLELVAVWRIEMEEISGKARAPR